MDVVIVENAGAFFHPLTYIHVGIQQEREQRSFVTLIKQHCPYYDG
jgi:hypothetical protein